MVETLTDNRNRTGAEVRNLFSRGGGSMAEPGAVSWQFERRGIVTVPHDLPEDSMMEMAAEAGADDLTDGGDRWIVLCAPTDLTSVRDALESRGVHPDSAELSLEPTSSVTVEDEGDAKRVLRLLEAIEDHDDVQAVHANYDIDDRILAAFDG
jgi:YebC/PmpR family DNA-binding regulatory protein